MWTRRDERSSSRLSGYSSQSAVTAPRIHQANLLGEGVEQDQKDPLGGSLAHGAQFQTQTHYDSLVAQHAQSVEKG